MKLLLEGPIPVKAFIDMLISGHGAGSLTMSGIAPNCEALTRIVRPSWAPTAPWPQPHCGPTQLIWCGPALFIWCGPGLFIQCESFHPHIQPMLDECGKGSHTSCLPQRGSHCTEQERPHNTNSTACIRHSAAGTKDVAGLFCLP